MEAVSWWAFWIWETADESFEMKLDLYQDENLPGPARNTIGTSRCPSSRPRRWPPTKASWSRSARPAMAHSPSHSCLYPHNIFEPSWKITGRDPPSYLVQLKEHRVVRAIDFAEQSSIVRYQICTRWCDGHGYLTRGPRRSEILDRQLRLRGPEY
jgi:hypothetical protein